MISSRIHKSKAVSSYSLVSLQTDSKNHVKELDKQFRTLSKHEENKPLVASTEHKFESLHQTIGPMRRMVHYVTQRKKKGKFKGSVKTKAGPKHQSITKGDLVNRKDVNNEAFEVSNTVLRKIKEIDFEKSRKEEDFISMIHDLEMLSEMTAEGTDEKFALLKKIEVLRTEFRQTQRELADRSDSLRTPQHRDHCVPLSHDNYPRGVFPIPAGLSVRTDQQLNKQTSSGICHGDDFGITDHIFKDLDCESTPSVRSNIDSGTIDLSHFEETNSQVESNELEELQSIILLLIAQRDALRTDFEGLCDIVSDLVCSTDDLVEADQKLLALGASKDALIREQNILLHDIDDEWHEQRKMHESKIESQTREIEIVYSELTDLKNESEDSKARANVLSQELKDLSRCYHENLTSIKVLQGKILEEEVRSTSLLLVKDFEYDNIREAHDAELVQMKNEISIISLENVLLSSKIQEALGELQCAEKSIYELNGNVNDLLLLIDQLRTQNAALTSEVGKLCDANTSNQQSAFSEKLELFHELNKARSTILRLQAENTSLSLLDGENYDRSGQSDMQQEIAKLRNIVNKIEAEKEELRCQYRSLFEQVVELNAQNTCQIGILMEKANSCEQEMMETRS